MKHTLVLGLGNTLAGDDAVAYAITSAARADAAFSAVADIVDGGTDVLRCAPLFAGRDRIIVIDAALIADGAASVQLLPHPPEAGERTVHAHALDPVAGLTLLRALRPEIARAELWWLLVEIPGVMIGERLTSATAGLVGEAVDRLRMVLCTTPASPYA